MAGCSTQEQRLAALRDYYVGLMSDRQWSMLVLEFKLFALRHAQLRPKLVKAHRRIRASLTDAKIHLFYCEVADLLSSDESIRRYLEATLHGLVLEHAYDPDALSEEQVNSFLRRIFDTLVHSKSGKRISLAGSE